MKNKFYFLILILFIVCIISFSLRSEKKYSRVIKLWHHFNSPADIKILNIYLDKFRKKYPDIKIQTLSIKFASYRKTLFDNLINQNGPDICIIPNDWLGELVEKKLIKSVSDIINDTKEYLPVSYKQISINDTLYALPFYTETLVMYYNKNIIKDTPPNTVSGLINLCDKIKDKCYPISFDMNSAYYLLPWYFSEKGKIYSNDSIGIDTETFIKTCNLWLDLNYNRSITLPILKFDSKKNIQYFSANNLAFFIDGPWVLKYLKDLKVDFGITSLPFNDITKTYVSPFVGTQVFAVRKNFNCDKIVSDLFNILLSDECSLDFARQLGRLPVKTKVYQKLNLKKDKYLNEYYKQIQKSIALPSSRKMSEVWKILSQDNLINIFNRKIQPEDFIKKYPSFLWTNNKSK